MLFLLLPSYRDVQPFARCFHQGGTDPPLSTWYGFVSFVSDRVLEYAAGTSAWPKEQARRSFELCKTVECLVYNGEEGKKFQQFARKRGNHHQMMAQSILFASLDIGEYMFYYRALFLVLGEYKGNDS
jgi:hypothetical protein